MTSLILVLSVLFVVSYIISIIWTRHEEAVKRKQSSSRYSG